MTALSEQGRFDGFVAPTPALERIRSLFAAVARSLARRRRVAAIAAELEALSDRDLADLGISRHDIRRIARQSVADA